MPVDDRTNWPMLARRTLLGWTGGLAALLPATGRAQAVATAGSADAALRDLTGELARYMAAARTTALPPQIVVAAQQRILDTIAAIVSGSALPPGIAALRFISGEGGTAQASVAVSGLRTTVTNAAFANAMFAHADETDDFEPVTKAHPGCSVVPAALAIAEAHARSGTDLIRAVTLGYDLNCRLLMALGPDLVRAGHRSAEGTGATIGATAAAASLAGFDETAMRAALSYAAQQTSGLWSWERDHDHIEKAFDFAGMGARNGVHAVAMIQSGFTGVSDVFDGVQSLLPALSPSPHPREMVAALGQRFFITETAIKRFSVGYPIQAALDAVLTLRRDNHLDAAGVASVEVHLPADGAAIVNDSAMPDVNLQYLVAVALIDGDVSFAMSHSRERMRDATVMAVRSRVRLIADAALVDRAAPRSARVIVVTRDGRRLGHFTRFPPGTKENPLDFNAVAAKAHELMSPVIGVHRSEAVIAACRTLDRAPDIGALVAALAGHLPIDHDDRRQ